MRCLNQQTIATVLRTREFQVASFKRRAHSKAQEKPVSMRTTTACQRLKTNTMQPAHWNSRLRTMQATYSTPTRIKQASEREKPCTEGANDDI